MPKRSHYRYYSGVFAVDRSQGGAYDVDISLTIAADPTWTGSSLFSSLLFSSCPSLSLLLFSLVSPRWIFCCRATGTLSHYLVRIFRWDFARLIDENDGQPPPIVGPYEDFIVLLCAAARWYNVLQIVTVFVPCDTGGRAQEGAGQCHYRKSVYLCDKWKFLHLDTTDANISPCNSDSLDTRL